MNDTKIRTRSIRGLTLSAVIAGCALSSSVAIGATGQVIGQLAADGEVVIGEGVNALDISNDVTPYFEGDLISTGDGSEAVVRFARSSGHFSALPLTDAVGRRTASGEFLVDASGTGVRFSFPADAEFTVTFDCMTIRNGAATDTGDGASKISGTIVAADNQVHVHSGNGRLIVSTDAQTEYLVKQDQSISSCTGTQVAAAGGATSAAPGAVTTTTGFDSANPAISDATVNRASRSAALKRAAGTSAAMLGTAAVSMSAGSTSISRNGNTAAAADQQLSSARAVSTNANGSDRTAAKAVKVSRNSNAATAEALADDASFTGGSSHRGKNKKHGKPHHGGCFGGAASPVAGGKHNKCKHKGGKRRHW